MKRQLRNEVPQGGRLTLEVCHILFNALDKAAISRIIKFADDTKIGGVVKTQRDVAILQDNLDRLGKWAQRWNRKLNKHKCNEK